MNVAQVLLVLFLAATFCRGAQAQGRLPAPDAEVTASFDLRLGVRIPMRDGVEIHATLYLPDGLAAKAPAVFTMTPYSSDGFHREASALARRGFVFAAVDVRGRGNSQGRFEPWRNDGRDGHDVVEWLARQPWSNGKVGMMGHSYGGRAVWSTLKEAPPHLVSAMPLSASFPMRSWNNVMTPDGILDLVARLDLLTPDGSTILLGEDWMRARFRKGLDREDLIVSGEPFELRFVFPFMARTLPVGSRLRLVVRSPSSIFLARNFHSERPVADQSACDARTARPIRAVSRCPCWRALNDRKVQTVQIRIDKNARVVDRSGEVSTDRAKCRQIGQ